MSGQTQKIKIQYCPQDYQREIHFSPKRYKVVDIGRRGGKTEFLLQDTIRKAVMDPGLHWIVAPSYRQAKSICWTRLKQILKVDRTWIFNEQELAAYHPGMETKIELRGADNEDSLRGVGLKSLGVDEAAMVKADVWPTILRPMLADSRGTATFISTPKGRNWFYDIFTKGLDKKEAEWASWHFPTSVNKYIDPEEIEQMKLDMSERLFKQEVLADFLDDDTGVFKGVRRCTVGELKEPIPGRFYVMGVDLAKTVDFTVLTVVDSVTREVVAWERFQEVQWREQRARIQALSRRYNHSLCIVDSTGVGDPIYDELLNSGVSADPFKFNNSTKVQLIEQLQIAIEERMLTWPRELVILTQEVIDFEYTITDWGNIKYAAPDGKHDDCVISLGLAIWGIRNQLHQAQQVNERVADHDRNRQGQGYKVGHEQRTNLTNFGGY